MPTYGYSEDAGWIAQSAERAMLFAFIGGGLSLFTALIFSKQVRALLWRGAACADGTAH